uniref:G-protein coupled receptors family 1 profile domain-containing protein n=1 Tax=Mastacembelus armatus TaxID=205130 RepID=A0A7N9ANT0_9TELE
MLNRTVLGDQNSTNDSSCLNEEPEWASSVLEVYILVISVLGIVFNVFVLLVIILHKKSCTVAEIYLSNLAAADLVLVSFLPFWAVYAGNKFNWPFGADLCRMINVVITMNAYCSIYFLVLISVDRYLSLVCPLSHERMRRPKCAKLFCLLVWVWGLFLSAPSLIYRKVGPFKNIIICYLDYTGIQRLLFNGMLIVLSFIIPISIVSYCTVKIIQALKNRLNIHKKDKKATTLVLAVLLAFLICWVPFHIMKIIEELARANVLRGCMFHRVKDICQQIFMYLAFFNSVLNPILYVVVGKNFQKKVKELFKRSSSMITSATSFKSKSTYLSRRDKV